MSAPAIRVTGLTKTFVLHNQGGAELPVLSSVNLEVNPGECVVLDGPSGAGKSTLLKCLYATYRATRGSILIEGADGAVDVVTAEPRVLLALRANTLGYVSQFLRVIPRVSALDVVAEPLLDHAGDDAQQVEDARARAGELLARLNVPQRLWSVAPATFSGGEQQRVNIARSFIRPRPVLLLDEPTASLDAGNRKTVIALIQEARERGAAIVGIFHDTSVRDAVATRVIDMGQ
jgi:alpha-D-ribose 1-methylphosphonate 5-triphosphate synthase subunit PhnL